VTNSDRAEESGVRPGHQFVDHAHCTERTYVSAHFAAVALQGVRAQRSRYTRDLDFPERTDELTESHREVCRINIRVGVQTRPWKPAKHGPRPVEQLVRGARGHGNRYCQRQLRG
jgi:hypothetical protein